MSYETVRGGAEERRLLLREFFLNACLMAMAKRVGEEAAALEEIEASADGTGSRFGLAEFSPCGCGCGALAEVS